MENENYELLIDRKIYDDLPDELKYDGFTFYKKEGVSVFVTEDKVSFDLLDGMDYPDDFEEKFVSDELIRAIYDYYKDKVENVELYVYMLKFPELAREIGEYTAEFEEDFQTYLESFVSFKTVVKLDEDYADTIFDSVYDLGERKFIFISKEDSEVYFYGGFNRYEPYDRNISFYDKEFTKSEGIFKGDEYSGEQAEVYKRLCDVFGDYEGEIINKIYDSPGEGKVWVEDEYILDVKEV